MKKNIIIIILAVTTALASWYAYDQKSKAVKAEEAVIAERKNTLELKYMLDDEQRKAEMTRAYAQEENQRAIYLENQLKECQASNK
ncbi:MAG: hypothetical protein ABFS32_15590 [Bacteroidota bacterium]